MDLYDASMPHFASLKNLFISYTYRGFRTNIFIELFDNNDIFFCICHPLMHFKSSLSTLSCDSNDSNARLVVDEDANDKYRLERVKLVGTSPRYIRDLGLITRDNYDVIN